MCEVHHGIGSSKEFPNEQFERYPKDKVKKKEYQASTLKEYEQK